MRVLSLDFEPFFIDKNGTASTFDSDVSVFDYDIVIWDPHSSLENYHQYETYQGAPCLSNDESARMKSDVNRRREEFSDYIDSGRHLIVIARPSQIYYAATGEVQTSGTGRNAARTRIVAPLDISSAIPYSKAKFARASGNRISITGKGPLQEHLQRFTSHLSYATTFSSPPGAAIAVISGTQKVIASLLRTNSGGSLALIPPTVFEADWDEETETEIWPDEAPAFQTGLLKAISSLDGTGGVERPRWIERFSTQSQLEVSDTIAKQEQAVERARKKLVTLRAKKDALEMRDQLFLGTGRVLELQVREVLEMLGGSVSEPEANRDDWRVDFDGALAAVEIKGVNKSAAEKHAAQLEKWVAGAYADTGVQHKGILVVNTWRETPLDERTGDDFPAQMLPYSASRGHVLLTGLDLFVIAADIEDNPSRADHWQKVILETVGPLAEVPSWKEFLKETVTGTK